MENIQIGSMDLLTDWTITVDKVLVF